MVIKTLTFVLFAAITLTGCAATTPGRFYTNITRPYSTDFHNSSAASKSCILDEHSLKEPVSGYGMTVEWSLDQINHAAGEAGISKISYIDKQTFSILMGLYTRRRLIIYGD